VPDGTLNTDMRMALADFGPISYVGSLLSWLWISPSVFVSAYFL
jgi:hypothetical protein